MTDIELQEVSDENQDEGVPVIKRNMAYLKDVDVVLDVKVGCARLTVDKLFKLSTGSVLKLEQLANEPVELLLKDHVVARGRLTVVDDHFGVEITEVMDEA